MSLKRYFSLALLLFTFIPTILAQQAEIDSIENSIKDVSDKKLLAKRLNEICKENHKRNPPVLLHFIKKSIALNKSIKDTIGWGNALQDMVVYYTEVNQFDSAIATYTQIEKLFRQVNYEQGLCSSKLTLAIAYDENGDYVKAIEQNLAGIECLEQISGNTNLSILHAKSNLGIQYMKLGDQAKAEKYWVEVISDSATRKDATLYTSATLNLCVFHRRAKQFDKAIEYGLLAAASTDKPRSKASVYMSLGAAYSMNKQYDEAHAYFLNALEIQKELKDSISIQRTYHNMGYSLKQKGDYEGANKYFLKSHEEIKKRGDLITLRMSYKGLSEMYEEQNDFEKALGFKQQEYQLYDSINSIEKQKAIADMEVQYETEKAKREKKLAELESSQNRNWFIGAILIAGLILISSLFYFSRMKARKQAELVAVELQETQKRLEIEKRYRDSELKALKAQMNPHFIFNALNSIQDYIVSNQKFLASDYLGKFADLIRNYLQFSDRGYISLAEEVHNLELYLQLEKLRFEDKLEYEFKLDEFDDIDDVRIPTMLIQPYIENALKHGLLHKPDNRKLTVGLTALSGSAIQCSIEDNGVGRGKSREINARRKGMHKSFALKATSERLDLLNHDKDVKIQVNIIDLNENGVASGTRVELEIPILNDLD